MSLGPLLAQLKERGVTLRAEAGKLRVGPASQLEPEVLELLKTHKPALLALLEDEDTAPREQSPALSLIARTGSSLSEEDVSDLLAQAEALITLYGPLRVDCGVAFALNIIRPETLVELRLRFPNGLIFDAANTLLRKWGMT